MSRSRKIRAVSKAKVAEMADKYVSAQGIAPAPQPEPVAEFQPLEGTAGITGAEPTALEVTMAVAETHSLALAPRSVVKPGYKRAYAQKALVEGRTSKAAKRANGDWLARELEAECIGENGEFLMSRFAEICELNGVGNPFERWTNRNNGWEGRLRMSGSIVLRGIVRKRGTLITPDTEVEAPKGFCAK